MEPLKIFMPIASQEGNLKVCSRAAGFRIYDDEEHIDLNPFYQTSTASAFSLRATVNLLSHLGHEAKMASVFSNLDYLTRGYNQWLPNWKNNGWMTTAGKPVVNRDLWEQIDSEIKRLDIRLCSSDALHDDEAYDYALFADKVGKLLTDDGLLEELMKKPVIASLPDKPRILLPNQGLW